MSMRMKKKVNMIPQSPAEGILLSNTWGDAMRYKVVCDCGQPEHDHDVWVEADDVGINVHVYVTVKSAWWTMTRFKQIWTLLTKGHLTHETTIVFNEQTALNYAETLKDAMQQTSKFKENQKSA